MNMKGQEGHISTEVMYIVAWDANNIDHMTRKSRTITDSD